MDARLARDIRLLKGYAVFTTLALIVLFLTAFQSERKPKFGEIDAERINIVEPDGRIDMVITDKAHFPPPMWKGKPMEIGRQGMASEGIPGIIFYNAEGDEAGGLAFSSSHRNGKYQAGTALMFDQYEQDELVGIEYDEENGERTAGLNVWERPNTPLIDLIRKSQTLQDMPEGPAKQAAMKAFQEAGARGEFGGQSRVFVGKNPKNTSEVTLADAQGKPRIRMTVEGNGQARLEFLDQDGKVLYSLPPGGGK
jgi:hypothetical protein